MSATAERMQARARRGETAAERVGPIVLFCARADAWMLDPEAGMARCLSKRGEALALGITERGPFFDVRWNARYWIENDVFHVVQFGSDQPFAVTGYPTRQITALVSVVDCN